MTTEKQPVPDLVYDPTDLTMRADPYPGYRVLRDRAPVYEAQIGGQSLWLLSRYDDVRHAAGDPKVFSSGGGATVAGKSDLPPFMATMLIQNDPPYHDRLRRLVQPIFSARASERWVSMIEELSDRLVDELVERSAAKPVDFMECFAAPLPILVIAEILGVPASLREEFKVWTEDIVYLIGGKIDPTIDPTKAANSLGELAEFFKGEAERRRQLPGDDLVSLLASSQVDGDMLSIDEIVGNGLLFLVGGNETTTALLGNMIYALSLHPAEWKRLQGDPELVPWTVEEALRYDAPAQGLLRTTTEPVILHDVAIPEGARVQLLYGSANRDEQHFTDPDAFDITRRPRDHFAFGFGLHHCIGAGLARMESRIALRKLVERCEELSVLSAPELSYNLLTRGFRKMTIEVARHSST